MNLNNVFQSFFVVALYAALIFTNVVFIYVHFNTYELWKHGERVKVKPIELLREPGHGYKGYRYKVEIGQGVREVFSNSKLDLNNSTKVILTPARPDVVISIDAGDGYISVFSRVTGGWFVSLLFVLMHVGILKLTYMCVKTSLEFIRKPS
jgi:hypothetical protein